ncbi:MAG: MFS transporter [Xanthomonadales bacterium]|nr:MFS transporter [Xanthomonadales bacterium]
MLPLRRFGLLSVIGCITLMPLLVLPAMVGTLIDETTLTETQAGWSASLNFLGGAIIAGLMALRMHRLDLSKVAAIGLLVAAIGDGLSGFSTGHAPVFLFARFCTGVGAGAAYTAVLAAFARLPEVDRGYAVFVTLQFTISGLGLFLLPVFSQWLGARGMFLSIAALDVIGLAFSSSLPGRAVQNEAIEGGRTELHVLLAWTTLLGALGFLIFEAALVAQYTYIERVGVSLALTDQQVGTALLVASLAGIPGALSIALLGARVGRVGGLSFGVAVAIAGLIIMISADMISTVQFLPYVLGAAMISFAWAFCLPYIQGLMAALDPHGSAAALGSASSTIGGAIGPGLAALVVGTGVYQHVMMFTIALLLLALTSFFIASRRVVQP